jgi:signal transduction histidine kinase
MAVIGHPSFGVPQRVVAIAASAVAFAFALLLLPGANPGHGELAVAAGLALAVIGVASLWRTVPSVARIGVALAYIGLVAVLIDGAGGTSSGFGGLFLLPVLWLAIVGSRAELVLGFVAVFLARALPVKLVGGPDYPPGPWRTGVVLGAVAVIGCVTMQQLVRLARMRASELHAQNEQLRQLDEIKDGFVALVSHELRTPLTSIIGFLEILLDDEQTLTSEQRQFLRTVNRNVERLAHLVNELLFLAQVDAGRLELQLAMTDLRELLTEATEAARPTAEAKNIRLTLEAADVEPLLCDRSRIAQLVDNLVSNAVKFTGEGGSVEVRADRSAGGIALSVSDTGIGIPPDEMPRLFGRFFRASSATNAGIPGTGLGLAISQAIAEAHDSTITVQSSPTHGTTFRLVLAAGG